MNNGQGGGLIRKHHTTLTIWSFLSFYWPLNPCALLAQIATFKYNVTTRRLFAMSIIWMDLNLKSVMPSRNRFGLIVSPITFG